MSCRCRWIASASVRDLIAHGYSLIDRKPAVGVGVTWRFAGTPPNLAASTHARASTEVRKPPGRLPEEDKGGALRSLLIESDFPVDATTRERNGESRRRKPYESLILDALTSRFIPPPVFLGDELLQIGGIADAQFLDVLWPIGVHGIRPSLFRGGNVRTGHNDALDLSRGRWYTRRCWNGRSRQLSKCVRCKIRGNPTVATKATPGNPNLFSTCLFISFSVTLAVYRSARFRC
jgi:hypothetical protein